MPLPFPRLIFLLSLTALYLVFELGFNARLLDIVGGESAPTELEDLELFGRFLTGCAVALFAVGYYYKRLINLKGASTWTVKTDIAFTVIIGLTLIGTFLFIHRVSDHNYFQIPSLAIVIIMIIALSSLSRFESLLGVAIPLFLCVVCTYSLLQRITDSIVDRQTNAQRQAALQTVLLQKGLLNKQITLDSIDMRVFDLPEGRAFLATFPLLAMTIVNLDAKIHVAKSAILEKAIRDRIGRPQSVYDNQYTPAIKNVQNLWAKYSAGETPFDADAETERQYAHAWSEYNQGLARHRWTPQTIPGYAKNKVVADVRKKVPVPANWNPADSGTFKQAIRSAVIKKAYSTDGSLILEGQRIAPGLDFEEFVKQEAIQKRLASILKTPKTLQVQGEYANADVFIAKYYKPLVKHYLDLELKKYEAPVEKFAEGKDFYLVGLHSIRKTLVSTIALLFSLLGAVSHAAKFVMILVTAVIDRLITPRRWYGPAIWCLLLFSSCFALLRMNNEVTSSELYTNMEKQALAGRADLLAKISVNALHIINVGQGMGYPLFESIRVNVLRSAKYGLTNDIIQE